MSVRIRHALSRNSPLDLVVRTPADVAKRLRWGDPFMRELLEKRKVLYEANDFSYRLPARSLRRVNSSKNWARSPLR